MNQTSRSLVLSNRNDFESTTNRFEHFRESCDIGLDVSRYIRANWLLFSQNVISPTITENSKANLQFIQVDLTTYGHCPIPGTTRMGNASDYPLGWRGHIYFKVGKDIANHALKLFDGTGLNVVNLKLKGKCRYGADVTLLLDDWPQMKATAAIKYLSQPNKTNVC